MLWFLMLAGMTMLFGRFWDAWRKRGWPINARERVSAVIGLPLVLYGAYLAVAWSNFTFAGLALNSLVGLVLGVIWLSFLRGNRRKADAWWVIILTIVVVGAFVFVGRLPRTPDWTY